MVMRSIGALTGKVVERVDLERAKAKAEAAGKTTSAPKIEGGEQPPLHSPAGREGVGQPMGKGKDRDANAPAKLGGERQTIDESLNFRTYYRSTFRVITNPAAGTMPTRQGTARNPRAKAPARAVLSLVCMDGVRVDHASTRSGSSR